MWKYDQNLIRMVPREKPNERKSKTRWCSSSWVADWDRKLQIQISDLGLNAPWNDEILVTSLLNKSWNKSKMERRQLCIWHQLVQDTFVRCLLCSWRYTVFLPVSIMTTFITVKITFYLKVQWLIGSLGVYYAFFFSMYFNAPEHLPTLHTFYENLRESQNGWGGKEPLEIM